MILKYLFYIVILYYAFKFVKYFKNVTTNDKNFSDYETSKNKLDILDGEFEELD